MKRFRNGEIWDFKVEMPPRPGGPGVVLGLDGGSTSTLCVCIEAPISDQLCNSPMVLGRAVAGCSNHNSIGETKARETMEQVMAEALMKSSFHRSAVQAVCLVVSGVDHEIDRLRILQWMRNIFPGNVKLLFTMRGNFKYNLQSLCYSSEILIQP